MVVVREISCLSSRIIESHNTSYLPEKGFNHIGEIHYHQENKTNGDKQIEFSAESINLKQKKSKVGINEMFSNC